MALAKPKTENMETSAEAMTMLSKTKDDQSTYMAEKDLLTKSSQPTTCHMKDTETKSKTKDSVSNSNDVSETDFKDNINFTANVNENGIKEKEMSLTLDVETKPMSMEKSVCKEFNMPPPNFSVPKRVSFENSKSNGKCFDNVNRKQNKSKMEQEDSHKLSARKEQKQQLYQNLLYKEPRWSGLPSDRYYFEVIKNGCIKDVIELSGKPYHVFGRFEDCDIVMEHPSISRYHAVIQYRTVNDEDNDKGFYLYDFGSTHGTYVNRKWIHPKLYHRVKVGYMVKFGGSTRLHILQGPNYDQEQETEKIHLEASKVQTELQMTELRRKKNEKENTDEKREEEEEGITWGMTEDAVEEEMDVQNLFGKRKSIELKDPKKTLKGFFEREGLDYDYEMEERGTGHIRVFIARIRLPVEDNIGDSLYAEGSASKKKDAMLACAIEACKILDAHDMLRNIQYESERAKRAKELEENDYYDSDEDSYMDRTGSVEMKRIQRMKRAGKSKQVETETYGSLKNKLQNILKELEVVKDILQKALEAEKKHGDGDDLDKYISTMDKRMDKKTKLKTNKKIFELEQEKKRLERLIEIAKPAVVPEIKWTTNIKDNVEQKSPQNLQVKSNNDRNILPEIKWTTKIKDNVEHESPQDPQAKSSNERNIVPEIKWTTKIKDNVEDKSQHSPPSKSSNDKRDENEDNKADSLQTGACNTSPATFKLPGLPSMKISKTLKNKQHASHDGHQISSKRRTEDIEEDQFNLSKKKNKKVYGAPTMVQALNDPNMCEWAPPEGQSGDGKTHLNDKFGY